MAICPEPDRDSRYPDRYCTTCGKGFKTYLECGMSPNGTTDRQLLSGCNQDGVVPPNPPNPDWDKPLSAAVETILSAKACPNAPMNATIDDGWTTAPIENKPSTGSDDGWTTAPIGSK